MTEQRSFQIVMETPEGLRQLTCGEDEFIWDAAAAHGVILPAICHQGRCLTCAARLLDGSVRHVNPDSYFPQDRDANFVLTCRAAPESDLRIRTHQEWEMRKHRIAHGLPAPYA